MALRRPALLSSLLFGATLCVTGCRAKPSEEACRDAIDNMRAIYSQTASDVGADPKAAIRSCRATSSKETVECLRAAKTEADLKKCEGEEGEEFLRRQNEAKAKKDETAEEEGENQGATDDQGALENPANAPQLPADETTIDQASCETAIKHARSLTLEQGREVTPPSAADIELCVTSTSEAEIVCVNAAQTAEELSKCEGTLKDGVQHEAPSESVEAPAAAPVQAPAPVQKSASDLVQAKAGAPSAVKSPLPSAGTKPAPSQKSE